MSNRLNNQHLLWRAGFGAAAKDIESLQELSPQQFWQQLKKDSEKQPEKLTVVENLVAPFFKDVYDLATIKKIEKENKAEISKKRLEMRKQSGEQLKSLNFLWSEQMVNSKAQLREKMSLFWHGHFACRLVNGYFQQELIHTIRTHALGKFGDLLKAVSKSAAMLQFLNNQQNRKQHPNENFAREVMELFTLGRGNYTETDIKEAARAFTGWTYNVNSDFSFREYLHDSGEKTFLGRTGRLDGDHILDILLENKTTARFITQKIYRFFVNEKINESKVDYLANRFYQSGYDIAALMDDIFSSSWFYDKENVGTRIKGPVELITGIMRFLPMILDNQNALLLFQNVLGQTLFFPPNVAGWPGGRNWIDSSTLIFRLQIPRVLAFNDSIDISARADDDVDMGREGAEKREKGFIGRAGSARISWEPVIEGFKKVSRDDLDNEIASFLLQSSGRINESVLTKYADLSGREAFLKNRIVQLMCTPEYQLC